MLLFKMALEAAYEIASIVGNEAPTISESINYGVSAYQAVNTVRAIENETNKFVRMAKRRGDAHAASLRKRLKGALAKIPVPGMAGFIGPLNDPGRTRTAGFYGRYNNPENRTIENKFFDTDLSFAFDATGEVPITGQLSLIPQGTEGDERIGRKTTVHSIQIRANIRFDPSASSNPAATCYLMLVLDKQCNGAAAGATDVMTSSSFNKAMINMSNSTRFKVIRRWTIDLKSYAGVNGALAKDSVQLEYFKKLNIPIEFSSTTGALAEIKSNNLFFLAGCDSNGSDDQVSLAGQCRLRFSD